jgi:sec-independent protein translocase protein TatC
MMDEEARMGFLQHLEEVRARVIVCLIAFIIIFICVYMLSVRSFEWNGWTIYYLYPDFYNNIPSQLFEKFKADLLPERVVLLNIGGIDALVANVKIAMFVSVAICTPIFAWQAAKFFTPALYPKEKHFMAGILIPVTGLFIIGALFAYTFFTPIALEFFYTFGDAMGIEPTMGVSQFLSWIIMMTLAFGIIFELPVFMAALTKLGVVAAESWKKGWRYAIIAFVIIGGFITPDVSGVTQILVAIPMTLLYIVGIWWALRIERKAAQEESTGLDPQAG